MFDTKAAALRLRATGLTTSQAHAIITDIERWRVNNGEEWTVERIKSLKKDLLRWYAGLSPAKDHSWIRYRRRGPKGSFSPLFTRSKKEFRKVWNAVMVYTGFVYDHPSLRITNRQWEKMSKAVCRAPLDSDALVEGIRLVHRSPLFLRIDISEEQGRPLVWYKPSPSRRSPVGSHTVPDIQGVLRLDCLSRRATWTSQNMDILEGVLRGIEPLERDILEANLEDERKSGSPPLEEDYRPLMGVIALIQEPGMKLRFAANPYRVYQMALQPLGAALYDALKRVPNDHTFDQEAGVEAIQRWLAMGLPSISMDLTNASDNIPLDLQLEMLSRYGVSTRWLHFYRDCCRGDWYLRKTKSKSDPPELIRWTVGAPLGLYPVFASFTLWHHNMVQCCFSDLGKPKIEGKWPYAIIGDDLWLGDTEVANLYVDRMLALGVPASTSKGLVSDHVADFAGRVITSKDVVQGIKWKGRCSDENFVDLCRNIGPGALLFLRPRQKRVISYIADLPEPYGLGWNPFGIPLDERLTPQIERLWSRDERVRTFERGATWINRLLYNAGFVTWPSWISDNLDVAPLASDQEALILTQMVYPGWEPGVHLWGNVAELLSEEMSLSPQGRALYRLMLQRVSSVERRDEVPVLVQLERKIRRVLSRNR